MDVVLECFDTFLFDRLYASVLPIQSTGAAFDPISTITNGFRGYDVNNTAWNWPAAAGREVERSAWEYKPASSSFNFPPSEYAWMSLWDRDNMARQFVSLYILTW
jgi:lathosterol oxidase